MPPPFARVLLTAHLRGARVPWERGPVLGTDATVVPVPGTGLGWARFADPVTTWVGLAFSLRRQVHARPQDWFDLLAPEAVHIESSVQRFRALGRRNIGPPLVAVPKERRLYVGQRALRTPESIATEMTSEDDRLAGCFLPDVLLPLAPWNDATARWDAAVRGAVRAQSTALNGPFLPFDPDRTVWGALIAAWVALTTSERFSRVESVAIGRLFTVARVLCAHAVEPSPAEARTLHRVWSVASTRRAPALSVLVPPEVRAFLERAVLRGISCPTAIMDRVPARRL